MDAKLIKELIKQIEVCVRDTGRSFKVSDFMTSDSSRSTAYRVLRDLRNAGVIEKKGREKYTVTSDFKKEIVKEMQR